MRRNKIKTGWKAIPRPRKKFEKTKISWTLKYEHKHLKEDTIISKIIKFIISLSLFFDFNKKIISKTKKSVMIDNTYNTLSSSEFKFIPSSVAFYLFLSFIPIVVIVFSIVNAINSEWKDFLSNDVLNTIIPGSKDFFTSNLDFKNFNFLIVLTFLIPSIWFASKGIVKLRESFTELYDYKDNENFIIKRIKGIIIVVFISLYFSLTSLAFTPLMIFIKNNIENKIMYDFLFYIVSFFFILFFGYIGIGLLFKFISPIKLKLKILNLGIITSLIPIIIFLLIFSTLCNFINYNKFGAIGSFLYLVIFILYISYFLHAGIIINSSYYKILYFQSTVTRKSYIFKRIYLIFKNIINKIMFNKRN